jgi:hypothetical protein
MNKLREHEEISLEHLRQLKQEIERDGFLKNPIIVDKNTNIILDGHHRFNSLKLLNCTKILAFFVDYSSPGIKVRNWREGEKVMKNDVIKAGLTGRKLSSKTSRHIIPNRPLNLNIALKDLV